MLKKLLFFILLLALCTLFYGCGLHSDSDNPTLDIHENAVYDGKLDNTTNPVGNDEAFIFTWLTYSELCVTSELKNKEDYQKHIEGYFDSMREIGVTDCFVQVRPFADAMYESEIFPLSQYAVNADGFDVLETVIAVADKYGVGVHAWVNPYRISTKPLDENSVWFKEYKDSVMVLDSGVYLNPTDVEAQRLILSGVQELLGNYDVEGIHIDDYFYPEDIGDADDGWYEAYKKSGGKKDLASWRRENVNSLVSAMYLKVKSFGDHKIFSVSPTGNIDKNYTQLYADIYSWCKGGYCDMILPQIYFGFENSALPFEECLDRWLSITDTDKVKLVPGLALYKCGKEDMFAGDGKDEWLINSDIIKRQVECLRDKGCQGFSLYSSSYINFSETFTGNELNNLKSVL